MTAKSIEQIMERLRYNAHDLGEMGKFIRVEYAENIVREALQSLLLEAEQLMPQWEESKTGVARDFYNGYNTAIDNCKQVLRNMRGV